MRLATLFRRRSRSTADQPIEHAGAENWRGVEDAPQSAPTDAATGAAGWYWTQHPAVQDRINLLISGQRTIDAYGHFAEFLDENGVALPLGTCATLGCGDGGLERGLTARGLVLAIDGYDPSEAAIAQARRLAAEQKLDLVHYHVADFRTQSLPVNRFDAIFTHGSMAHVEGLEQVFGNVRRALKPGGMFHLYEFVGPNRFQWTDMQLQLINGFLDSLPEHLRRTPKGPKALLQRPSVEQMTAENPTMAARSAAIRDVLGEAFDIVEDRAFGGALLHMGLADIAQNFDPANAEDIAYLDRFFELEDRMVANGTIGSDFAVLTARPRPIGALPRTGAVHRPAVPFGMAPTRQLRPPPGPLQSGLDLTVSKADTMLTTSDPHYLSVGESALAIIERSLGGKEPANILDLPCGFGRVTRVLRARYPHTAITASDLDRPGVDFTAYQFGARGVYSVPDFRELDLGETYDLIWVGSLITHLPAETTKHLLAALARSLTQQGSALITLQGPSIIPRLRKTGYGLPPGSAEQVIAEFERTGFGYRDYVGGEDMYGVSLTNDHYGISLTDEPWMRAAVQECGLQLQAYEAQAWDNHHDVAIVRRIGGT